MNKKIQIAAVEMKALSEVIVLNSSFVAKAARAADVAQKLKHHADVYCLNITREIVDEKTGDLSEKTEPDYVEWMDRDYNVHQLGCDTVADVFDKLVPFAIELCNALLGEEA